LLKITHFLNICDCLSEIFVTGALRDKQK